MASADTAREARTIKTYQDLQRCGENETNRISFIYACINDHEKSPEFYIGHKAGQFYRHHDPNIEAYQNIVYDIQGRPHVDEVSPNHKIMCNFYETLIDQAVEYLLGNGISFDKEDIKDRLSKQFDHDVKKMVRYAANDGESYALIETNGIVPMCIACQIDGNEPYFIPLKDERTGAVKAGIKYWRLAPSKPLMVTLYEEDGYTEYTEYREIDADGSERKSLYISQEKTAYIVDTIENDVQGAYATEGKNYSALPIVRMGYINNQSALVGNEGTITAYNMALSGFANQVDWNLLYWIINNADGMSQQDDVNFLADLIKTHVLHTSGEATATPHEISIQHEARGQLLDRLRKQLFEDMEGVDVSHTTANMTATEIKSAYSALNRKCDKLESYIDEFLTNLLNLIGFEDETWHYQRDVSINPTEATNNAIAAAPFLGDEATTKTLCEIQGKIDEFENIQRTKMAEAMAMAQMQEDTDDE